MPVRGSGKTVNKDAEKRKEEILRRIQASRPLVLDEDIEISDDENDEKCRQESLQAYKRMICQTMDLPLEKLILTPEGCDIFDTLCIRIDVNQKYADLLPQWKDLAHQLQIDDLVTKWVETCVRPREGLTRAVMEIYMKDGGTLGEVLEALLHLELLQILEETRPGLEKYIRMKDAGELIPKTMLGNENFFSVMKTLLVALGNQDPCQDLYKFANGLKNGNHVSGEIQEQTMVVQSATEVLNDDWPRFDSEVHLKNISEMKRKEGIEGTAKVTCKILVLFAEDGVVAAETAIQISRTMLHMECDLELFRLNEATLWYEVLVNPEACCMKWTAEADYIMPILTPRFLTEIHGKIEGTDNAGLLPTSPILNKFMYNLARSQYTSNGCKNYKVRPLIPTNCLGQVKNSNAVKLDPLLAHTWKALKEDQVKSRLKSMMNECIKRKSVTA